MHPHHLCKYQYMVKPVLNNMETVEGDDHYGPIFCCALSHGQDMTCMPIPSLLVRTMLTYCQVCQPFSSIVIHPSLHPPEPLPLPNKLTCDLALIPLSYCRCLL